MRQIHSGSVIEWNVIEVSSQVGLEIAYLATPSSFHPRSQICGGRSKQWLPTDAAGA